MKRAVLRLVTCNVAAQVIVFAASLVLPYFYAPQAFAEYAVFASTAALLGQCVHLRLTDALRLASDKASLIGASIVATLAVSLLLALVWPLLALAVAAISASSILHAVLADCHRFPVLGHIRIGRALILAGGQIALSALPRALELTYIAAHALPGLRAVRELLLPALQAPLRPALAWAGFAATRTATTALVFAAQLLPLLAVRHAYDTTTLAAFAFADRIVGAAVAALSVPLETVLFQILDGQALRPLARRVALWAAVAVAITISAYPLLTAPVVAGLLPPAWAKLPQVLALTLPTLPALIVTALATRLLPLSGYADIALVLTILALVTRTGPFLLGLAVSDAVLIYTAGSVAVAALALALLALPPRRGLGTPTSCRDDVRGDA